MSHPDPTISAKQAAGLLGISLRGFQRLKSTDAALGAMCTPNPGRPDEFQAREFGEWFSKRIDESLPGHIDGVGPAEVLRAKALEQIGRGRKLIAEAGIKEDELRASQQAFGSIALMTRVLDLVSQQIRSRLATLPDRLSEKYQFVDGDVHRFMRHEIAEALADVDQLNESWETIESRTCTEENS